MKIRLRILFVTAISLCLIAASCKKKKKKEEAEDPADTFDKSGMLNNYADNVILPSYTTFSVSLDSLNNAYNTFKASNSLSDFQFLKHKFISAYFKFQACDLFEFGPAESATFRFGCNVFPADTGQIRININAGTYNLNAVSNIAAIGFPALEYLFYGSAPSETAIVQTFTNTNRKQYTTDLLNDMRSRLAGIISSWNGSYKNTFITSLSSDLGSSIGYLVNQLNYELDHLKNDELGIPLGKRSLGVAYPNKTEAYYSQIYSVQLAVTTLNQIENVYLGRRPSGNDDKGFDDYLEHLGTSYNGGTLNQAIKDQIGAARTKLAAIPNPLSAQMTNNTAPVEAAYQELVKLLVLMKTDMTSALGVIITYQDGDGD